MDDDHDKANKFHQQGGEDPQDGTPKRGEDGKPLLLPCEKGFDAQTLLILPDMPCRKQLLHGDFVKACDGREQSRVWLGGTILPLGDRLVCDSEPFADFDL